MQLFLDLLAAELVKSPDTLLKDYGKTVSLFDKSVDEYFKPLLTDLGITSFKFDNSSLKDVCAFLQYL